MIVPTEINDYLEGLIPKRDETISDIESYAKQHHVPIMELVGIEVMLQLLRLIQPRTILEIGTAIGYSSIRMAKALPNTQIITLERDEERYNKAIENINKEKLENQIKVIFGDALELVDEVKEQSPFDSIFIDAAKGQYVRFFELYSPYLSENGIVFSDNVLFRGLVAKDIIEEKRHQSIVKKLKSYNEYLMNHADFHTTILTVGDGIAISRKR